MSWTDKQAGPATYQPVRPPPDWVPLHCPSSPLKARAVRAAVLTTALLVMSCSSAPYFYQIEMPEPPAPPEVVLTRTEGGVELSITDWHRLQSYVLWLETMYGVSRQILRGGSKNDLAIP